MHSQADKKRIYQSPHISVIRCVPAISIMSAPTAEGNPIDPVAYDDITDWN